MSQGGVNAPPFFFFLVTSYSVFDEYKLHALDMYLLLCGGLGGYLLRGESSRQPSEGPSVGMNALCHTTRAGEALHEG